MKMNKEKKEQNFEAKIKLESEDSKLCRQIKEKKKLCMCDITLCGDGIQFAFYLLNFCFRIIDEILLNLTSKNITKI